MTDHPTAGDKPTNKPAEKANSPTNGPTAAPTNGPAKHPPESHAAPSRAAPHVDVKSADQTPDMPITAPNAGEYGVDQMKYLTDLEHVRERLGHVHRRHRPPRLAPPGLRSRRQLDRRGDGRPCARDLRHDQCRRLGHGRRRRPRHSGRDPSRARHLHAARRDDRAQVRRQVRQAGLQDLRRLARHRRQGRQLPLANGARSKSAATGTSISRNTSAACRPATSAASARTDKTGTKTTFKPDPQIFGTTKFDYNTLHRRLQELAFLNRGVKIAFGDERTGDGETFQYERGIAAIRRASEPRQRAGPSRHHLHRRRAAKASASKSPCSTRPNTPRTFTRYVNNINTIEGGTHLSGFRTALTRTLNNYGKKNNLFKDLDPHGRRFPRRADGRSSRVRVPEPQFEGANQDQAGQQRGRRASSTRPSAIF